MSQNYETLIEYLDNRKCENGSKCTHTSMGKPLGAYSIPNSELNIFYDLYNKHYKEGIIPLHIIERHSEYSPIVIDIDFKFEENIEERQYDEDIIKDIINLYNEAISECFIIDNENQLTSFVFERTKPYKSKQIIKDGIHIMYPYIISKPNIQYLVREKVLKRIEPLLKKLNLKNTCSDVLDRAVIESNGWFMYGSHKPNIKKYVLTHIYDHDIDNLDINFYHDYDEDFKDIVKFLSIRRHDEENACKIKEEILKDLNRIDNKNIKRRKKTYIKTYYDINKIVEIINILDESRANDYNNWFQLGSCLFHIDPSNNSLLELWDEFSKKSTKYKSSECEKMWNSFKYKGSSGFTIATLYYWAKKDSPELYEKIKSKDLKQYIIKSINKTPYDVAIVLYEMFKDKYVCCSSKNKIWYEFENHKWNIIDDAISLRAKISKNLLIEYCKVIQSYNDYILNDNNNESDKDLAKKEQKALVELTLSLKKTAFKDNVMKEAKELFYKKDFLNKLDANPYLIGFNNGIYNLQNYEFRDGRPDDYITMSTNIDYIDINDEDYINDSEENYINDIMTFMTQIIPKDNIKEYILLRLSTYLEGYNKDQKLCIWTGVGGNGKSKLQELFVSSFGDYCIKFSIALLTQKRAASNACQPEVALSKGKRLGYFAEPNPNDKLNIGLMKELTGGDTIKARTLYKEPEEFIPQFKLMLLCNHLPSVPPDDIGSWRRIETFEFPNRFVNNPSKPNEFPIDFNLSEKLQLWKETFMAILIKYYKIYKTNGIKIPDEITAFTLKYKKTCDLYLQFLDETIIKTDDKNDVIPIIDLHDEMKDWYTENYNNLKIPCKRELKIYLDKNFSEEYVLPNDIVGYKYINI